MTVFQNDMLILEFDVSMTVVILAREFIDLGFDTFEAYKMRWKVRLRGHCVDESDTTYRWVAPYFGFVKYQDAESLEVLTDFAIGGETITPTTDADGHDHASTHWQSGYSYSLTRFFI
jgi:hypothetical protein